jgi:hypothetical protein
MRPIASRIAVLSAKIDRARQLVAEHRLHEVSKSDVIVHDLTSWLHSLEARMEDLRRQSDLMAQRDREVA